MTAVHTVTFRSQAEITEDARRKRTETLAQLALEREARSMSDKERESIALKGKTWHIVSHTPYKTEDVDTDLYMLGVVDATGNVTDYVRAGRPSTYRVYTDLRECRSGIRGNKRFFKGNVSLVPVRLLTGEIVKEDVE